jgi:Bacterial membrane protein YfhO
MLGIRRQWMVSPDPGQARYLRWVSPLIGLPASVKTASGAPVDTAIVDEREAGGRRQFHVDCRSPSNLVIKMTYNPNWHVTIDGRESPTFSVSPAFLAVVVPPGRHEVVAEYRSSALKSLLMIGGLVLLGAIAFRRRFFDVPVTDE